MSLASRAAVVFLAACRLALDRRHRRSPRAGRSPTCFPSPVSRARPSPSPPTGTFDPWPSRVWVDAPGITFKPTAKKGKFDVEIAKDAAPGPHLVRLFNAQGASIPRFFIVSEEPELLEVEPNDDFKSPQKIASLPATINGRLDKVGDVDSFGVTLKRGQTLIAWVEAYVLASTFDGMLRIVDAEGNELAFNHDGRTLDPLLTWEAPSDGAFVVQLMGSAYPATASVEFTGGEGCVYRLHLSAGAPPRPAAARRPQPRWTAMEGIPAPASPRDGGRTGAERLALADAQSVAIPCAMEGRIQKPGDEDRFAFTAVKQHYYQLAVTTARPVSPLETWLRIDNAAGKTLARGENPAGFARAAAHLAGSRATASSSPRSAISRITEATITSTAWRSAKRRRP